MFVVRAPVMIFFGLDADLFFLAKPNCCPFLKSKETLFRLGKQWWKRPPLTKIMTTNGSSIISRWFKYFQTSPALEMTLVGVTRNFINTSRKPNDNLNCSFVESLDYPRGEEECIRAPLAATEWKAKASCRLFLTLIGQFSIFTHLSEPF